MISTHLATRLREAGLRWRPAAGDRFVIPQPELDGEVFTLSEMTIEAHEYPTGTVLGFNGTTEWALDSVDKEDALWLPREDQLRELLGGTFVSLGVQDGADDGAGRRYAVRVRTTQGPERTFTASSAADAYAGALLALVEHAVGASPQG
ncbi:pilus assembly protein CpaE [Actinotalea sp. K2]|uniref:pilus assembly protein CpaE n=1 Tax=Actinotalea sp. K2 TaxID=2939438 RepID=UPI002018116C|nr:pilus assembly protein CpaE [Actinotalea sp. K2]MCL3860487.1 pilus assembly protein CpaE [Actinotalea sp. K2]